MGRVFAVTTWVLIMSLFGCNPADADRSESTTGEPATGASSMPSFDCASASGQIETLVCQDEQLGALDRGLDEVYQAALRRWPENIVAEQRAIQRGWISGRNECWKTDDPRACTVESYQQRTAELQIRSGALMAATPVGHSCTGGEDKPFWAAFYSQTNPPSVVLTYGDDQVIGLSAPSASGSRYVATNMVFWEHQGEATVDWYGVQLTCRPVQ